MLVITLLTPAIKQEINPKLLSVIITFPVGKHKITSNINIADTKNSNDDNHTKSLIFLCNAMATLVPNMASIGQIMVSNILT